LECRAADILQPDIGTSGGIMEVKKIPAMAEAYSMRIQPHVCASPVATAAALQLDACIANFIIQEVCGAFSNC
jgi:galactonate dehydratase